MGQTGSKKKLPYLIGVKENIDIISDKVDVDFSAAYNDLINSLDGKPQEIKDYIQGIRSSSAEKYSEQDERKNAVFISDNDIRNKIIYILGKYSHLLGKINSDIKAECNIQGFCPRHVVSEDGTVRPLESLDRIHPCQNRACMREQLEDQLRRYKRWMITGKWAGDTAKSKSSPEDVPVNRSGMIEILERLQQSILLNIELASADHTTGANENMTKPQVDSIPDSILPSFISGFISLRIIIAIIILAVVILIFVFTFLRTSANV